MITFFVEGRPATQGSKKWVGGKRIVDSCKRLPEWRKKVGSIAKKAMKGKAMYSKSTALQVTMDFFLNRPKNHFSGYSLKKTAPKFPVTKPDLLKMARAIEDAMTGIVYVDDSQIAREILIKTYVLPNCREVEVPQGVCVSVMEL